MIRLPQHRTTPNPPPSTQVIALACHLVGEAQAAGGRQPRPFLIAAPASVLPNWEAELARWAPSLKASASLLLVLTHVPALQHSFASP